jgi:hypothetical protein
LQLDANKCTFSAFVFYIIHITFIVCFSTNTWNSHCLSFKVFSIKTFWILLSSNVCYLLTKETFVIGSMSTIIKRAPKFKIRWLSSRLFYTFTWSLMKTRKIKSNHYIFTLFMLEIICLFVRLFILFIRLIIWSINNKLLWCTFRFNNNIIDINWNIWKKFSFTQFIFFLP